MIAFARPLSVFALIGGLLTFSAASYPDVYSDGACDINYQWEHGQASSWYIELQRTGGDAIRQGTETENQGWINIGIGAFNWAFAKQQPDGSFVNTGDPYHSTSLFVYGASKALLELQEFKPVTFSANYSSTITSMSKKLLLACKWLAEPSNLKQLMQDDQPYTHRRYLVAAALAQTELLNKDTSLLPLAEQFASEGLLLQQASGVNPEMGGYDVEYQAFGILCAEDYLQSNPNSTYATALQSMIGKGLSWEAAKISATGAINTAGSTRVGHELNRNGTVKQPTPSMISWSFENASQMLENFSLLVPSERIKQPYYSDESEAVDEVGAVGTNDSFASGKSSTFQLGLQNVSTSVLLGSLYETRPDLLSLSSLEYSWGATQQAKDGSFPNTSAAPYNVAEYVDSLYRSSGAVTALGSQGAGIPASLATEKRSMLKVAAATAPWMGLADTVRKAVKDEGSSASGLWLLAVTWQEVGLATGDTGLQADANQFAASALALQGSNGLYKESAGADYNSQANSILYALEFAQITVNSQLATQTLKSASVALTWEGSQLDANGTVLPGGKAGSYFTISNAFKNGYDVLNEPLLKVIYSRINLNHGPNLPFLW